MINEILNETESKMSKTIESLKIDYSTIRAGRANPALLDKIFVDYYGAMTPINQMANISVPEPRMLVIQPWDKSTIATIEKAILKSDLGLTPSNDGTVIRINIPQLTKERRAELVKIVKKKAEDFKVEVRNVRRNSNDELKKQEKAAGVTEDDIKRGQEKIQKLTDKFIEQIDKVLANKEAEILEV